MENDDRQREVDDAGRMLVCIKFLCLIILGVSIYAVSILTQDERGRGISIAAVVAAIVGLLFLYFTRRKKNSLANSDDSEFRL